MVEGIGAGLSAIIGLGATQQGPAPGVVHAADKPPAAPGPLGPWLRSRAILSGALSA